MIKMAKTKFVKEYEINASLKLLFPYISTASGLAEWIADNVNLTREKNYCFIWDNEKHFAKLVGKKDNQWVKFEFLDDNEQPEDDPSYLLIELVMNDFTGTVFFKITDYSEIDDEVELTELWDYYFGNLKQHVGG